MLFHSLPLMPGHAPSDILQGPFSEKRQRESNVSFQKSYKEQSKHDFL